MNQKEFLALLDKYIANKTDHEEEKRLRSYFESFQQNKDWPSELGPQVDLKAKMLKRLMGSIDKPLKIKKNIISPFLKYAAVLVIGIGLLFLFVNKDSQPTTKVIVQKENTITLKLNNGTTAVISENDHKNIIDSEGNVIGVQTGNQLNYKKKETTLKRLVYNELTVPHGKRFDLILSDGTKIKLNSGSSIKYPIEFIEGKNREVEIWGEAYFEVTKDKDHPFIVHANHIAVEVLGTKFNISSYEEDEFINTVLVEGSVQLFQNLEAEKMIEPLVLEPNHKASWSKVDHTLSSEKVDTDLYTSWVSGRLVFRNIPFKNIRRKLERHYNVSIINNNKSLEEKFYNASFDIETIEQVMEAFKENYSIDYSIDNNQITIN